MRRLWKTSLGLSLGLLASAAGAQEPEWRPLGPPARTQPAEQGGSQFAVLRTEVTTPPGQTVEAHPLAVSLDRPTPLASAASSAPNLQPASFRNSEMTGSRYVANQQPVEDLPRPMPLGGGKTNTDGFTVPPAPGAPGVASGTPASAAYPGGPADCWGGCGVTSGVGLDGCGVGCCADPIGCCTDSGHRFYASVDWLLWGTKRMNAPPLVTSGTAADNPGILGRADTTVLFDGSKFDSNPGSGIRFTTGYWFGPCQGLGVEASFFWLNPTSSNFLASSSGTPNLGRPFFNTFTGAQGVEDVTFLPDGIAGAVNVHQNSRLWGGEVNFRNHVWQGCWWNVDFLWGFRSLGLDESLGITENLTTVGANPSGLATGSTILVQDNFATKNRFYGGQIGFDSEFRWRRWFVDVKTKIALGGTEQTINVGGSTVIADPTAGISRFGTGLLAQQSNSGRFTKDCFTVVPEVGINVGYQITDYLRAYAGYNFLYWSSVARPGDQIDRAVNPTQIAGSPVPFTGPLRPAPVLKSTDFWAQGLNVGLEFRY